MITSTHLKQHNMTSAQYKEKFPNAPMVDEAMLEFFKERSKKSNESRKGIPRSDEVKQKISDRNRGKQAWNKGIQMPEGHCLKMREAVAKREEKYKTGVLTRHKTVISEEQRKHLSEINKGKKLSKQTIDKIQASLKEHCNERKKQKNLRIKDSLEAWGFDLLMDHNDPCMRDLGVLKFKCKTCKNEFIKNSESYLHDKMCTTCHYDPSSSSIGENELASYIRSLDPNLNIVCNDKITIGPLELDIHLPQKQIAIEYCGLFWHSEKNGVNRFYHQNKFKYCREKNLRLIQVFEDEWKHKQDIVKERIRHILGYSDKKVNGRDCWVTEIGKVQAGEFLNKHHIQGEFGRSYRLGLFYKEELVSVMTFDDSLNITKGKKKTTEQVWELSRYATKYHVNGGAGKLFKHFIKQKNPNTVISYSDLRWGAGNLYTNLGFKFDKMTCPNYWYVIGQTRKHRFSYSKQKLIKMGHSKDLTEREITESMGLYRIYDAGSNKFIWQTKEPSCQPS